LSFPDAAGRGASASPSDAARAGRKTFPRAARLTRREDFLAIYETGLRVPGPNLVLFGRRSRGDLGRLGVTVTRKCGGAVIRNLMKRRIREIYRLHREEIPVPLDLVVNVRRGADGVAFSTIEAEFIRQLRELARKVER
jgi:ribonuclease P protein component